VVPPQESSSQRYTLVYDGECRVCTRSVDVVRRWDTSAEIDIVAYQDAGVILRFPWIPTHAFGEAMQLVGPSGETWQGAAAVEQLLMILPRGRWVAWIYKIPLVRSLADRLYRWFARNRYRLGCGQHCAPH
jgi:predicted DCC family thiol-disulfide oxidoreductase YuxK